jgi:hypothetical protein
MQMRRRGKKYKMTLTIAHVTYRTYKRGKGERKKE